MNYKCQEGKGYATMDRLRILWRQHCTYSFQELFVLVLSQDSRNISDAPSMIAYVNKPNFIYLLFSWQ